MKKAISIFLSLLMLLSVCGFAALADGETTKEVTYIDASGTAQTVEATVAVPGSHYGASVETGWYVIEGTYSGDGALYFEDAVTNLILSDDVDWTITNSEMVSIGNVNSAGGTLNVYVQENNMAKLQLAGGMLSKNGAIHLYGGSVSSSFRIGGSPSKGDFTASNSTLTGSLAGNNITLRDCIVNGNTWDCQGVFTIDGGTYTSVCNYTEVPVRAAGIIINNATVEGSGGQFGLHATGGSVTISDSTVNVTASSMGIFGSGVSISGGNVTATSTGNFGIYSSGGPIEITGGVVTAAGNAAGVKPGGTLTLGADTPNSSYSLGKVFSGATVTVKDGQTLTDGENDYTGTLSSEQVAVLAGKTLTCKHAYDAQDWAYDNENRHVHLCKICGTPAYESHEIIVKGAGNANCGYEGYTGDEVCSVCGAKLSEGDIIPPTGNHTTALVNAKEATATADGYTGDEVCTVCGKTIKTGETIPATGETAPDTPDAPDDSGDCPFCGKHHDKLRVRIGHLVLAFLRSLWNILKK